MQKRSVALVSDDIMLGDAIRSGYTSLDNNPEIVSGCMRIAELISSMTIYLMANTERGDIRVVNELSRKVDILPSRNMTRKTWMDAIVMNLLLYGNGNSIVVPHTESGMLGELEPISASRVSFMDNRNGTYSVLIDGKAHDSESLLHFVYNPDRYYMWKGQGIRCSVRDIIENLSQANKTTRSFMQSKWKPSVVIKVDGLVDEFSSPEGRKKLLDEYISTDNAGEPWIIPSDQFSVEQIKPLSLTDLAISDSVQLDKKTVAALLGVPPFVLGVGEFKAEEWNAFVSNTVRPIAKGIEQELTRKLLISPKMYFMFNISSLYSYDLQATANVYSSLYDQGIVTGNEVRERLSMEPKDGLDELVILENYIPASKTGDQKKLKGGNE